MNNKLFTGIFLSVMILLMGMTVMGALPGISDAELSKEKSESLVGYLQTGNLGNTVAAGTSLDVSERGGYADTYSCISFVTNSTGIANAATATWTIQGSLDDSHWATLETAAIATTETDLMVNAAAGGYQYYRANITAMSVANASYVSVQCIFQ